jgi:acyl carrier protein
MNIEELVKKISQEFDDIENQKLTPECNFKQVLNWSSINAVVMSTMIEFEYGVMIPYEDFLRVNTIAELADLIEIQKRA